MVVVYSAHPLSTSRSPSENGRIIGTQFCGTEIVRTTLFGVPRDG